MRDALIYELAVTQENGKRPLSLSHLLYLFEGIDGVSDILVLDHRERNYRIMHYNRKELNHIKGMYRRKEIIGYLEVAVDDMVKRGFDPVVLISNANKQSLTFIMNRCGFDYTKMETNKRQSLFDWGEV